MNSVLNKKKAAVPLFYSPVVEVQPTQEELRRTKRFLCVVDGVGTCLDELAEAGVIIRGITLNRDSTMQQFYVFFNKKVQEKHLIIEAYNSSPMSGLNIAISEAHFLKSKRKKMADIMNDCGVQPVQDFTSSAENIGDLTLDLNNYLSKVKDFIRISAGKAQPSQP